MTPGQARRVVARYLADHSGQREFQATLPSVFSNAPTPVLVTNKSGRVKTRNLPAISPHVELSRQFQKRLNEVGDYSSIYRLIGGHLADAEAWLSSTNTLERQRGLRLALEAHAAALADASDAWLAARLVEGYVWPNLDLADAPAERKLKLNDEHLLDVADRTFREADETDNLRRNYQLTIQRAPQSARTDKARFRLARLYEDALKWDDALRCYRQIQNTNKVQNRIAALELRLKPPGRP